MRYLVIFGQPVISLSPEQIIVTGSFYDVANSRSSEFKYEIPLSDYSPSRLAMRLIDGWNSDIPEKSAPIDSQLDGIWFINLTPISGPYP